MDIDDSCWPVVVATCPTHFPLESVGEMSSAFGKLLARHEKFVLIVDARPLRQIPEPRWRKELAAWMNEPSFREAQSRYNLGSANILPLAAPLRAVMTAITWLWNPPTPQSYPGEMREAIDWALGRLQQAGVSAPPGVDLRAQLVRRTGLGG